MFEFPQRFPLPESCAGIVALQRRAGRFALTPAERAYLARCYDEAAAAEPTREVLTRRLLTRPFSRDEIPPYYRYTSLHVYDWYLAAAPDPVPAAVLALQATLADLAAVEAAAVDAARRDREPRADLVERLERIDALLLHLDTVRVDDRGSGRDLRRSLAEDPAGNLAWRTSVLAACTDFPQSDRHDEHVFLRCVQACELVFYLVRVVALRAVCSADPVAAGALLDRSAGFAGLLNRVFEVLATLSPRRFMSFREETGQASAVQSLNFHLMELVVYGYDPNRAEIFARVPHLAGLNTAPYVQTRPLAETLGRGGAAALAARCAGVERELLVWRGRHYGFGRRYLPNLRGSGGTDGAAYLKRFVVKGPAPVPVDALSVFACA